MLRLPHLARMASSIITRTSSIPLIAVVGATGTGKSQLAVELAKRFDGEVVNGDAMQLYAGLPIITNKITETEQQGIPHHLIGTIGPDEPPWVVSTFVKRALSTIDEIRSRGRLPILVGGTHYYTQSLLFHDALAQQETPTDEPPEGDSFVLSPEEQWPILSQSTEVLLDELRRVDPEMAARWHPKDRRKIQRSLMIYLQTGQRASDIYAEQKLRKSQACTAEVSDVAAMRFPRTLLIWVHAEKEALRERLDTRVDKMLEDGLLAEVQQLHDHVSDEVNNGRTVDETRGIWVSIGFKEFRPYYQAVQAENDDLLVAKAKAESIERTKIATRQYAKAQVRWIRLKLIKMLKDVSPNTPLFLLDGTELASFEASVTQPAIRLTDRFLKEDDLPPPESICSAAAEILEPLNHANSEPTGNRLTVQHCHICNVSCATESQWLAHTKSKTHRKLSSKARALENAAQDKSTHKG